MKKTWYTLFLSGLLISVGLPFLLFLAALIGGKLKKKTGGSQETESRKPAR